MPLSYRRLSTGKGQNRNQGGGSKLQGLPAITNMPVLANRATGIRAGGEHRNYFFLINQLSGGVGKMYSANSHQFDGARGTPNGPGPWGNNPSSSCCPFILGDPSQLIVDANYCAGDIKYTGDPTQKYYGYFPASPPNPDYRAAGQLEFTKYGPVNATSYHIVGLLGQFTSGTPVRVNLEWNTNINFALDPSSTTFFKTPDGHIRFVNGDEGEGAKNWEASDISGTPTIPGGTLSDKFTNFVNIISNNGGTTCNSIPITIRYDLSNVSTP